MGSTGGADGYNGWRLKEGRFPHERNIPQGKEGAKALHGRQTQTLLAAPSKKGKGQT